MSMRRDGRKEWLGYWWPLLAILCAVTLAVTAAAIITAPPGLEHDHLHPPTTLNECYTHAKAHGDFSIYVRQCHLEFYTPPPKPPGHHTHADITMQNMQDAEGDGP